MKDTIEALMLGAALGAMLWQLAVMIRVEREAHRSRQRLDDAIRELVKLIKERGEL